MATRRAASGPPQRAAVVENAQQLVVLHVARQAADVQRSEAVLLAVRLRVSYGRALAYLLLAVLCAGPLALFLGKSAQDGASAAFTAVKGCAARKSSEASTAVAQKVGAMTPEECQQKLDIIFSFIIGNRLKIIDN